MEVTVIEKLFFTNWPPSDKYMFLSKYCSWMCFINPHSAGSVGVLFH